MCAGILLIDRQLYRRSDEHSSAGIVIPQALGSQLAERIFYHPALKLLFKLLRLLRLGKKIAGLDIDQSCGHFKEIRSDLVVKVFNAADIFKILLQQQAYLDIVNIQLML